MITVHGRTCEQGYKGPEYDTVAAVQVGVAHPVVNGDITSVKSPDVGSYRRGRGDDWPRRAGPPWIFAKCIFWPPAIFATAGGRRVPFAVGTPDDHYALYVKSPAWQRRKHIGWYVAGLPGSEL
jgi:hypothetical protein